MEDGMKSQLREFVSASSLEEEMKSLWGACVDSMLEEEAEAVWDFIGGDASNLSLLTDNLLEKSKIGNSSGSQIVEAIIANEKKILEMFINGEHA